MLNYILRRLGAGLLLLAVVTAVTFWIFYVLPRWAGVTPQGMAAMYVGKAPTPEALEATVDRLGLDQPVAVQFYDFVRSLLLGQEFTFGRETVACGAPRRGYSFTTDSPVFPALLEPRPAPPSAAAPRAWVTPSPRTLRSFPN